MGATPIGIDVAKGDMRQNNKPVRIWACTILATKTAITVPISMDLTHPCPVESIAIITPAVPSFITYNLLGAAGTASQQAVATTVAATYFEVTDKNTITLGATPSVAKDSIAIIAYHPIDV